MESIAITGNFPVVAQNGGPPINHHYAFKGGREGVFPPDFSGSATKIAKGLFINGEIGNPGDFFVSILTLSQDCDLTDDQILWEISEGLMGAPHEAYVFEGFQFLFVLFRNEVDRWKIILEFRTANPHWLWPMDSIHDATLSIKIMTH